MLTGSATTGMPHSIALLAFLLCPRVAATFLYPTANQTIGRADQLPIIDLGYALYKPTNFNVSLCEVLIHIHFDMKRSTEYRKVL